jgi:hypothetical protein
MKNLYELKDQLIAEPKETLNKEFGIELSDDVDVKVLFETENTRYIVIPFKETELNENEIIRMGKGPCSTTNPGTHTSTC